MAERRIWRYTSVCFSDPNGRYIVRSRSSAVLLVLAVVALAPSLGVAQYTPKWHVGDWWVTKTLREYESGRGGTYWRCDYNRHDVAAIEKVGQNDCYVIEIRGSPRPSIGRDGAASIVLHVRTDNWLVVRTEHARQYGGKRISPDVRDYPRGLFGPFISEPRLPRFPLQPMNQDTAFKTEDRIYGVADLREISRPADPALVERLLAEGDTADIRVVRPSGVVHQVRNERGGNFVPGPQPGEREILQSIQLWSDDLPWRLYEAVVDYRGPKHVGRVQERSWLVAVGKRGR
jgi:hypothetical protein